MQYNKLKKIDRPLFHLRASEILAKYIGFLNSGDFSESLNENTDLFSFEPDMCDCEQK